MGLNVSKSALPATTGFMLALAAPTAWAQAGAVSGSYFVWTLLGLGVVLAGVVYQLVRTHAGGPSWALLAGVGILALTTAPMNPWLAEAGGVHAPEGEEPANAVELAVTHPGLSRRGE